jgi:hypothetical protein
LSCAFRLGGFWLLFSVVASGLIKRACQKAYLFFLFLFPVVKVGAVSGAGLLGIGAWFPSGFFLPPLV